MRILNLTLWVLRFVLLIPTLAAVILGLATFFANGWFLAGMAILWYHQFIEFHRGWRKAFKGKQDTARPKDVTEYVMDYKAPLLSSTMPNTPQRTNMVHDASYGYQDGGWYTPGPSLAQTHPEPRLGRATAIQCPGCQARYARPFPKRCRHCRKKLLNRNFVVTEREA